VESWKSCTFFLLFPFHIYRRFSRVIIIVMCIPYCSALRTRPPWRTFGNTIIAPFLHRLLFVALVRASVFFSLCLNFVVCMRTLLQRLSILRWFQPVSLYLVYVYLDWFERQILFGNLTELWASMLKQSEICNEITKLKWQFWLFRIRTICIWIQIQ